MVSRSPRCDISDHRLVDDNVEPTEANDPTENAETADPTDPTERNDPTDPIDSAEPCEAIERNESCDHSDHFDLDWTTTSPSWLGPTSTSVVVPWSR
jgi:hypothetical protein